MLPLLAACAAHPDPALAPAWFGSGATDAFELRYELTISVGDPASELVHLRAHLRGLEGPLELSLPERSSYITLEPRLSLAPAARTAEGEALGLERLSPFLWRLDPGEATEAWLDWTIQLDHRRHPEVVGRDEYEQPYLRADYGLLTCASSVLVPALEFEADQLDATVHFALPPGWNVEVPWPETTPNTFRPPDVAALSDDLIAIGAWDIHREQVGGVDVSVAFAPGQGELKEALADSLGRIVEAELELFGMRPHERYLFLFVEPAEDTYGFGGSTKPNSILLFLSQDLPVNQVGEGLRHLLAHEYHHSWMLATCMPADELRFVVEGFTDWYASVVPRRLGLLSTQAFHTKITDQLTRADQALAKLEGSLAEAGGDGFFAGGAAYDACYAAGYGLAAWTELALARAEAGLDLDELMRRFYNDPRWEGEPQPTLEDWFGLLEATLGSELAALQQAAVTGGEPFDWVTLFAAVGLDLEAETELLPPSARANFEGNRLTGIDPAGAAAALGLRSGDLLLEINGRPVVDERTARGNWRADEDGRIALVFEREGERLEVAGPYPTRTRYSLSGEPEQLPWG